MTGRRQKFIRSAVVTAFAIGGEMWSSGAMLGADDTVADNAGYEMTGGIEQWETTVLHGGDYELIAHIEPMWAGNQHRDDQACAEGEMASPPSIAHQPGDIKTSRRHASPDADAIIELLKAWGVCPTTSCAPDVTGDGLVETADLMRLLFGR